MPNKLKVILGLILVLAIATGYGATLLYEDFEETTFPPSGWTIEQTGTAQGWTRRTSGQVFRTGASAGVCIFFSGAGGNTQGTSYLCTPALNFSSPSVESLSFYFRCTGSGDVYGLCSALDTIKVEVSTNGSDWISVLTLDSNYIRTLPRQTAIRDTGYKLTCDLSAYNGQSTVYIRWIYYDNYPEPPGGTNRYFNIDSVYVYNQELFQPNQPPTISNITRIPTLPEPLQPVVIKAKIYDDYCPLANITDSLYYAVNDSSTWTKVYHDSMRTADSTFYYTIPGQANGSKVYYYVWAQDDSGASVRTSTYSYNVIAPPTVRILMRPRYVQGGATTTTGTPFAFYVGVKPGSDNDSFYYKGRIGGRGLTWNISGNNWATDNAAWTSLSKILCGSVNDTAKLWVFMKAQPSATVDTFLSLRVRHIDAAVNYDSDTLPIKILDMTASGDGGWLYGHIYEYNGGPARENVVVLAYQGEEIVGAYATENNNIDEGYNSGNAGYIRMAVKAGTIDSLQVRHRTTNEILPFYTEIPCPWIVYPGDSTSLDIQQAPYVRNVTRTPRYPVYNEPVTITAKIYDNQSGLTVFDTLLYAINSPTDWQGVNHVSYNPADSIFSYTINVGAEGDTVFYKIHVWDNDGNLTTSPVYRYKVPFERTILQIQNNAPASADTNRYVHTKGIVTGTIGARFFIEEMPGGAWHGLYIYRRAQDSLPKLMVGDSVGVWGIVKEYYTLTEIDAGYNLDGAVEKYASGRAVPCTTKLRFDAITEEYEGTLIRVDSVYFKESGNFSGGTNYWLYSLTSDDSVRLRIDAATPIVGISIPQETLAIICNLSAYKDTYQLMPRTPSDFLPYYFDLAVTEILQPRGTVPSDVKIRPKAKVKNLGSLPSPACRAVFNITESKQFEYTDTVDLTALQPGQEVIVSFRDYRVLGNPGTIYQTEAKILVSDRNSVNNVLIGDGFEVGNWLSPRWYMQPDVPQPPDLKEGKYVKDGGALVAAGNVLYAFPGNKSRRFYKFTPSDGWGTWAECESIPFGPKPGKPTQLNNKKVGKGAALCYDGSRYIYATKGNGTFEFWKYDIQLDTWFYLDSVPTIKGLKGGTSLAYQGGYVYLLAGGLKLSDDYFFRYSVSGDSWEVLPKPNLPAHVTKPWKDGSAIVAYGGYIYAMKGGENKVNYFAKFNCASRSWAPGYDSLPTYNLVWTGNEWREKKSFVKDGGALTLGDGYMYAIKGGGAVCLFAYDPAVPYSWYQLDTIPKRGGEKKSVPKTGAALAYLESNHYLYLMIGNNRPDFWRYGPLGYGIAKHSPVPIVSSTVMSTEKQAPVGTVRITSNLLSKSAVVSYSIIRPSYISLKLYDALGRVVANMYEGQAWAGTYTMTIDTKSLSSGVYFLKLTSDYGNAEAKLLIE
ncbi:MAG: choice-of-anchor J domain-containing protein [candidate division WOR-3 bacterium]